MNADRCYTGLRVLDFGRVVAGPHCARWMADLGADVIKVERPPYGDDTRSDPFIYPSGDSTAFMQQNWGKRSLCLDLRHVDATGIVHKLVNSADVLIENFRPGVMKRLGFSYPELSLINPRIVFCSISQYGQTGPYATRRGYGPLAEAESGMSELTGEPDGPPMPTQVAVGDSIAAGMALGAIGAALYYRERTGRGQQIDISLLDATFQMNEVPIQEYIATGGATMMSRRGIYEEKWVPGGYFQGNDGWVCIYAGNESMWPPLAALIGRPELGSDPEFATFDGRRKHRDEVYSLLREWVSTLDTVDRAVELLVRAGVPAGRVNDIGQAVNHPQIRARKMLPLKYHKVLGPIQVMNSGINLSETKSDVHGQPPRLGEHNGQVLRELGYSRAEYLKLVRHGAVFAPKKSDA